jgi:predicted chitinase
VELNSSDGTISSEQFIQIVGLTSSRRAQQLVTEGLVHAVKVKGKYRFPFPQAVQDYITYWQNKALNRTTNKDEQQLEREKLEADVKYKNAKAKKAELETAELEGKMHNSDDVEVLYNLLVFSARNMLEAFPARTASLCVGKKTASEIQAVLEEEAKRCMLELKNVDYSHDEFKKVISKIMRERIGKEEVKTDEDFESTE